MEKTIRFNAIVYFIDKAIAENLNIECTWFGIEIYNGDKCVEFILGHDNDKKFISFRTVNHGLSEYIYLTEEELLYWELLRVKCKKYQHDKAVTDFSNFFKEDSKPTDINDLDNDDE